MTIAEGLVDFLWNFTDENGLSINDILTDAIEGDPYVLSVSPSSDHTIKRYLNKDEVKEANFQVFLNGYTRQNYERENNTQLVDKMKAWINRQNKKKVFPKIGPNKTCTKIEAVNGIMYENNTSREGLYLLQVKITYYERMRVDKYDEYN